MICAACCKEHSTRAEWRADHLGLSWSHPLIVLDRLWAAPSNAHINTCHDLHVIVGPQPHDSCWPSTSSIPSSQFCSSDWPKFPQTFIFNNEVLPHQRRLTKTDHKTASTRNSFMSQLQRYFVPSDDWPVTQGLNQGPAKLSKPVKAVHKSTQWNSPSTFWLPYPKFSMIFTSSRCMASSNSVMRGPQP